MTKKTNTKHALLMSALALLLCISMFVGSTFAWFTDSVTSGNNKIVAGNLDVVLQYKTDWDDDWADVTETTKLFKEGALYEPGYTEVVYLRVANAGSLALKYQLALNIANEKGSTNVNGEAFNLSDHLEIGTYCQDEYSSGANYADILMPIMFGSRQAALSTVSKEGTTTNVLTKLSKAESIVVSDAPVLAGDKTAQVIALVLTMPETVGNEANYDAKVAAAPEVNLGVSLVATQYTDERDSFDNQYDKDADFYNPEDDGYEVVYIYDIDDFTEFGKAVNNNSTYGGVKVANNNKVWVEVMADIDMTNTPGIQGGQFAIGNGNNIQYTGVFDGNGHIIKNYNIEGSWTYNVSLFRTVSGNFTIKDITFDNCSASKPNNRVSSILVGTIGGGTITFDNVDIKNSTVNGVAGCATYVGNMTEGALYFRNCDVNNVTLNTTNATGYNAMFLRDGYSYHDLAESGVWVEKCTIANSKSVINTVEEATIAEYNYTK